MSRIKQQRSELVAPSLKPSIDQAAVEIVDENSNQNIETPKKQWNKKRVGASPNYPYTINQWYFVDRSSRHVKKRLSRKLQVVIDDLHASTAIDTETHKRLSLENQQLFPASNEEEAEDDQGGIDKVEEEERDNVIEALRNYLEKRNP